MKRWQWILLGLAVVAFFVLMAASEKSQASLKVAYVDLARAAQEFKEMKKLNADYKADFEFYQNKLKKMEEDIKKLEEQGASKEEIDQKKRELLQKKQLFEQLLRQDYQPKAQEILNKVVQKAKEYAKEKGFDLLVTNNGAVYASERLDVTDDFIDYLNSSE